MNPVSKHQHIIDCDIVPNLPAYGLKVVQQKIGKVIWVPTKIGLYLSKEQAEGKIVKGFDLREIIQTQNVLSANVLDFLLANPELIPENWRDKYIYFWGTIYKDENEDLCVRCLDLRRKDGRFWACPWLGKGWNMETPAAVWLD